MSDIDQLAQSIGGVAGKIDEAASVAVSAALEAEDAVAVAEMLGSEPVVSALDQIKDDLETLAAALENASGQATAIQALAKQVSEGSSKASGLGAPQIPPATADPAGVPSGKRSNDLPAKKEKKKVGSLRRWTTNSAKRVEDVQDVVDATQERFDALTGQQTRPPEPPEVTSSSTQSPGSPSDASGASAHGVEASTLAGGLIALGVAAFGVKEVRRRGRRMLSTPDQFPDEKTP